MARQNSIASKDADFSEITVKFVDLPSSIRIILPSSTLPVAQGDKEGA